MSRIFALFLSIEHLFINMGVFSLSSVYIITLIILIGSLLSLLKFFAYFANTICLVQFCSHDFSENFNPVIPF